MNNKDYQAVPACPIFPKTNEEEALENYIQHQKIQNKRKNILNGIAGIVLAIEILLGVQTARVVLAKEIPERLSNAIEMSEKGTFRFKEGIYSGDSYFGAMMGKGVLTLDSGTVITGEWENKLLNGSGKTIYQSGNSYVGNYRDSVREGYGIFTWADGAYYAGEWKADVICGNGVYTAADGTEFIGSFKNNTFMEGECKYSYDDSIGTLFYSKGEIEKADITCADGTVFTLDEKNGTGETNYSNGDCFSGKYSGGKRNGQGEYVWASGDTYSGSWENDRMSGEGTYTFSDGSYAQGIFANNTLLNGKIIFNDKYGECVYQVKNGAQVHVSFTASDGTVYNGDILNGELTGNAEIRYRNGDVYTGHVLNGMKSGEGTYKWKDGASYTGNWSGNLMHGTGSYYYNSSSHAYAVKGTFKNGKPHGKCDYYTSSSRSYKTDWSDGKCVKIYE